MGDLRDLYRNYSFWCIWEPRAVKTLFKNEYFIHLYYKSRWWSNWALIIWSRTQNKASSPPTLDYCQQSNLLFLFACCSFEIENEEISLEWLTGLMSLRKPPGTTCGSSGWLCRNLWGQAVRHERSSTNNRYQALVHWHASPHPSAGARFPSLTGAHIGGLHTAEAGWPSGWRLWASRLSPCSSKWPPALPPFHFHPRDRIAMEEEASHRDSQVYCSGWGTELTLMARWRVMT